jgi:VCBS repeat-containing protein
LATFTITGTFTITSLPGRPSTANDPPIGTSATLLIDEDVSRTLVPADFGFADPLDSPSNALLAVRVEQLPAQGELRLGGVLVPPGSEIGIADLLAGRLIYRPPADASGSGLAAIGFRVRDDGGTAGDGRDLDPVLRWLTIDVRALDDVPRISLGTPTTVIDGAQAWIPTPGSTLPVAPGAVVVDPDGGTPTLTLVLRGDAQAPPPDGTHERLLIPPEIVRELGNMGVTIDPSPGHQLVLRSDGTTNDWVEIVLQAIQYANDAPNPTPGTREVTVQVGAPSSGQPPPPLASTTIVVIDAPLPPPLLAPVPGQLSEREGSDETVSTGLSGSLLADPADDASTWTWSVEGASPGTGALAGTLVVTTDWGRFVLEPQTGGYRYLPHVEAVESLHAGDSVLDRFVVTARDAAGAAEVSWTVQIRGANDPPSALLIEGGSVREDAPPGTVVLTLGAIDGDQGEAFVFSLSGAEDADPSGRLAFEIVDNRLVVAPGARLDHERSPDLSLTVRVTDSSGLWLEQPVTVRLIDVLDSRDDVLALDAAAQRTQAAAIVDAIAIPELALLPLVVRVRLLEGLGDGGQGMRLDAIEGLFDSDELVGIWNAAAPAWFARQASDWLLRALVRIEGDDLLGALDPGTVAALLDATPPESLRSLSRELRNTLVERLDESLRGERQALLSAAYGDAERLANLAELPLAGADGATLWLLRDAVAALPGAQWASLGAERTTALLQNFAFADAAGSFPDGDGDGAPDWLEGLAPAPTPLLRLGDGNGDGVPDAVQATVRSAPLRLDGRGPVGPGADGLPVFAVLALEGVRDADPATGAARIVGLDQAPVPTGAPASSVGLLQLAIQGLGTGASIGLSLRLPELLPVSGWWAASASGLWVNATGPASGGSLVSGAGLRLDLVLRDGTVLDVDAQADGRISGEALLADIEVSLLAHTPDLPALTGFWF